jgi:hypothetical protein
MVLPDRVVAALRRVHPGQRRAVVVRAGGDVALDTALRHCASNGYGVAVATLDVALSMVGDGRADVVVVARVDQLQPMVEVAAGREEANIRRPRRV